jgi:hypothetical protein
MARDRDLDDQIESDEELLNFDLDDLSLSEDSGDDLDGDEEIIELVDLVERGSSEDITRDLKVREWAAGGQQKERPKAGEAARKDASGEGDDEGPDLDISDLSIELEIGTEGDIAAGAAAGDEITEADLEGLLEEDDSLTLDFSRDEDLESKAKPEDEITDADLQALLSETGEQDIEEEVSEPEPLDISDEEDEELELEPADETQALDLEPSEEEEPAELEPADETQALDFKAAEAEGFIAEEPTVILEREAEELGAAAERAEIEAALPSEDFPEPEEPAESEGLPGIEEKAALGETEIFQTQTLAGISEERLEEIITNVVRDVVERVARETMAEVAERMISEAIETLKQSLEASES